MADNVTLPGTGEIAATDQRTIDGASVQVQRVAPHGTPGMSVAQVTVTNSSTTIAAARSNRQSITLVNRQPVAVWIAAGTADQNDFRLDPGDSVTLGTGAVINGITAAAYTASADAKVHVVELHD